jgi:hypothetical protein
MEQRTAWEANSRSTGLEIPRLFYQTQMFITVYTSARHQYLTWARWIQSRPSHPISSRSILILSSYLRLGPPSDLFPPDSPTKILYAFLMFPLCSTCSGHLIVLDLIIVIIFGESRSYEAFHYAILSNLLWLHPSYVQVTAQETVIDILNLLSSFNARDTKIHLQF